MRGRSSRILLQISIPKIFSRGWRIFLTLRKLGLEGAEDTRREKTTGICLDFGLLPLEMDFSSPGCARVPQGYEILGFLPRRLLLGRDVTESTCSSGSIPGCSPGKIL